MSSRRGFMLQVTVRYDQRRDIEELAGEWGCSRAAVVRAALDEALHKPALKARVVAETRAAARATSRAKEALWQGPAPVVHQATDEEG